MRLVHTANGDHLDGRTASPGRSGVHRILRNGTFNVLAQILYALFQAVVVIVLARVLGPNEFGQYQTLFTLIMIIQLIMEIGIGTFVTQRIAQAPDHWRQTVAEASGVFTLVAAASVAVFVALGGIWAGVAQDPAILLYCGIAGVVVAAIQVQRLTTGVLRAYDKFGTENLARILEGSSFAVLVLALWLVGRATVTTTMVMLAVSRILASALLVAGMRRQCGFFPWHLSWPVLKGWVRQAIPLGLR
jgi:O-antigen/teichoic acid export membrane protein